MTDRIFSYLHFSFGLIHPFDTEQLHLDRIVPQLPCSCPIFPLSTQKESPQLLCCLLCLSVSHKVAPHGRPSAHGVLAGQPWHGREQRGAGADGQSMLGAPPSAPVPHVLWGIHTFPLPTQAVAAPPVPNPPPFWLQVLAAHGEPEDWEVQVPPRGKILRCCPLIMVFSE